MHVKNDFNNHTPIYELIKHVLILGKKNEITQNTEVSAAYFSRCSYDKFQAKYEK